MKLTSSICTRSISIVFFVLFWQFPISAQNFTNPILRGGYPDPSICRVGRDFYLVNSTFEYFPGLPIHHSRDLVNWQLVGHGLHRKEQVTAAVNLVDVQSDGGIHAPTLRCRDGKFYIVTTNVYSPLDKAKPTEFVNFVITADKPEGPWSDPIVFEGAPGIDPDIFFDEDGRVWYAGTHSPEKPRFPGEGEIWLQEIDTKNWKLTGERHFLWRGACGGTWAEGPHIYKRDGRYYLMVAEGGTHFDHGVMIAVSDKITGPYQSNPRNPILTSRHLSYDNWVHSTGHGDLVELEDGRWYMVALGIRGDVNRASNMGRETHLVPVRWEREPYWWKEVKYEWPVAAPQSGRVEIKTPLPYPGGNQYRNDSFVDNFETKALNMEWNFRRYPLQGIYSLDANPGHLRLYAKPEVIAERGRASLMGFRQTETDFDYTAKMYFEPSAENVEAGIILFQKDDNYISYVVEKKDGKHFQKLVLAKPKEEPRVFKRQIIPHYAGSILLRVSSRAGSYDFEYSIDKGESFNIFTGVELSSVDILSKGYTGAYLGIYATSNGQTSKDYADFDWVRYEGYPRN
ncbi:MAG: glycoside hydrolase family 43 protein [Acidobacteriota bacterium]|nr:glycoside hydrolase family 43 protein [Acidobacteriota bacterium]MDH3528109.1 glycoside hydrolase family 43 protein [Acidobacteriota bacterium]